MQGYHLHSRDVLARDSYALAVDARIEARVSERAPDNSSKPTPLRGAAYFQR